ncbi:MULTISPECIES: Mor transcription activator family protein [Pseudomonas]|uniref:Mor transcription activator family protein n=1 Tax=Pseudomonas fluorescens TaxID=294 RepID=A0A109KKA2_PSEFL|nr:MULTISPECIES: Mor transcription activator family protein [Pseudomonas]KWV66751.1 Mor transcription activator family protein [Pseudomonas fluorescens]KWV68375.1 Mor transcription activator family protein [Pseudomonas fluorescens]KWV70486.1 Mor transcription activator family protein [Pseudomonas fluorescens]KWV70788.1 Mor transcription activator family protein [Pseudomonas fluorescens]NNA01086.1 hypothetical protein [Pseudomonas lundensis]
MRTNEFAQHRRALLTGTELSASLAAVIGDLLRKRGISDSQADEIALEALGEIRFQYSGQNVYFASEEKAKKAEIHERMFDRYDSGELSVQEVSQEYGCSLQWAYHIIRTVRTRRREERSEQYERDQERWEREN